MMTIRTATGLISVWMRLRDWRGYASNGDVKALSMS